MPAFYLTPDAKSDLITIRQYTLKQWGTTQSEKYLSELRKTIQLLAEAPSLGISRPDVGSNVQSFPHASHVIYYMSYEGKLIVFGVLHKRMLPLNHLSERDKT